MWAKEFRFLVFVGLYSFLFWEEEFSREDFQKNDLEALKTMFYADSDFTEEEIKKALDFILKTHANKSDYKKILLNYLNNWDKTYLLTQSILFTFLAEIGDIQKKEVEKENIVGKYIRLTQEMVGGQSTALVHAVASKILEDKLKIQKD